MENLNKEEGEELHDNNRRAESGVPPCVPGLTSDQPPSSPRTWAVLSSLSSVSPRQSEEHFLPLTRETSASGDRTSRVLGLGCQHLESLVPRVPAPRESSTRGVKISRLLGLGC